MKIKRFTVVEDKLKQFNPFCLHLLSSSKLTLTMHREVFMPRWKDWRKFGHRFESGIPLDEQHRQNAFLSSALSLKFSEQRTVGGDKRIIERGVS